MVKRSPERIEFLTDLLTTAIENGGYGWFTVETWRWEDVEPGDAFAEITAEDGTFNGRIDLDTMARGLGVIKAAVQDGGLLRNAATSERLYLSPEVRASIMLADHTNGDDGDLDVVDALAVLECALFGSVVYV
jgi:hypothetical protein